MNRFPKLSLVLSVAALLAFSSAGNHIASADSSSEAQAIPLRQATGTCAAAPNTARDGAADHRLAAIRAQLEASILDEETIPLNGSGYNYRSDANVSNGLLTMDAALQR